ncbi:MAG: protein kinase [Ferruginibacter sp.]|nr:protein kinase [Ferruginibacter sp.]
MAKVFTITEGLENMGALKTGGQGSVYKARRIGEIITAVKLLPTPIHSESDDDKNFLDFQNEVQKLKRVNREPNPHVVKILNSGLTESGNLPFIEMEFIEGPDVEDLLKPPYDPIFSIKEIIKVADQLSYALEHCHKVDVKHGDIKSNNVKFNVNTGNYVLLDFGLAIMSEEQRRSSMRHAGAIEFMAPEQSEGLMYFQTDIYSYGIILFELLTGSVPFPLTDKSESARNRVMVAHMEMPVPDILSNRRLKLPQNWSDEKKEREMQVPQWLISTIQKCLEKSPDKRFKDGMELHRYIIDNSTMVVGNKESNALNASILQNENERLRTLLIQYQEAAKNRDSLSLNPHKILSLNEVLAARALEATTEIDESESPVRKRASIAGIFFLLFLLAVAGGLAYKYRVKLGLTKPKTAIRNQPEASKPAVSFGLYKVISSKAYFHNTPDENSRRSAYYMVNSNDTVTAFRDTDDFIYTEFYNSKNQLSKGWLRKKDLLALDKNVNSGNISPPVADVDNGKDGDELGRAANLLNNEQYPEALTIYSSLAKKYIPEAMYHYGELALKGKNDEINCLEGIEWLKKAANRNYTPAKRVLGFLYMFAENESMLMANDFIPCPFRKDTLTGGRLLIDAVSAGDTTAIRYLEQINKARQDGQSP